MKKNNRRIVKKIFSILTVLLAFFYSCLYCNADPLGELTNGLSDGIYIIERVNFAPSPIFRSEKEAKAWLEASKKDPQMIKPERDFFQLYLAGNDFIIRQLNQKDNGEYESKGNFFVSISSGNAWAFEEAANRVTVITNFISMADGGPIVGLLETGDSFCKELKHLGLNAMDLSSIKSIGKSQFVGRLKQGNSFEGKMKMNYETQITNIVCKVNSVSYDLNFDIFRDESTKQLSNVTISKRESGGTAWHPNSQYIVEDFSPLKKGFPINTFWTQSTNSDTLLVFYDSKEKKILIQGTNGIAQPLQNSEVINYSPATMNLVRWFVLLTLGATTILGAFILIRSWNHSKNEFFSKKTATENQVKQNRK